MSVTVRAYAKINLMLDILSKLDSGYHELFMVMQSVGIFDTVTVSETGSGEIKITCDSPSVPLDEKNIAHKAAKAFFEDTKIENKGIEINIEKNIPQAAGLAGGSADGAAVLTALNKIYGNPLSEKELITTGAKIGADVPFCILGGTMLAQYTGTVLSYLPDLEAENIVIVKPEQDISTGEAYSAFDTAERVRHLDTRGMLLAAAEKDSEGVYERVGNVFEQFIEVADRAVIKSIMRKYDAKCCCMSGSGPSIFGIFEKREDAEKCLEELKGAYEQCYLCSSVTKGCEIVK